MHSPLISGSTSPASLRALTRAEFLVPLLGALAAIALVHHPVLRGGLGYIQTDEGDARFCAAIFEHTWLWLTRAPHHLSLFDPPFFFPAPNVLGYSEVLLGSAFLYWPWRALGIYPDTSFQLWVLSVTAANFTTCYLLLRRPLSFSMWPSVLGALLFSAAAMRTNQTGHAQLLPQFWSVLVVYAAARFFAEDTSVRARRVWAFMFFASASLQLWSGFYLGWFLGLGILAAVLAAFAFSSTRTMLARRVLHHPFAIAASAILAAASLFPLAKAYLSAARELGGGRSFTDAEPMLPRIASWFDHGPWHWLYSRIAAEPVIRALAFEEEHRLGFGLITAALCAAGLFVLRKRNAGRIAASVLLVLVAITLYVDGSTLYRHVYAWIPGAVGIRAVSRIGLLLLLPLAIGVAGVFELLIRRSRFRLAVALAVICVAEQGTTTPAYDKLASRADVEAIAREIKPTCTSFLYTALHGGHPFWKYQIDAIWASLRSGVPTLNGYSGSFPRGWRLNPPVVRNPQDDRRIRNDTAAWLQSKQRTLDDVCWVRLAVERAPLAVEFGTPVVPTSMSTGQLAMVEIPVRNTGVRPWRPVDGIRLGSQAPQDNRTWGANRVDLPHEVAPGESATFRFELVAPARPGMYPFAWGMVHERHFWFGRDTPPMSIRVGDAVASP